MWHRNRPYNVNARTISVYSLVTHKRTSRRTKCAINAKVHKCRNCNGAEGKRMCNGNKLYNEWNTLCTNTKTVMVQTTKE